MDNEFLFTIFLLCFCCMQNLQGEIRCVVGQARLVMVERFQQFSGLIDNCEFNRGHKETTCMDFMHIGNRANVPLPLPKGKIICRERA